MKYRVTFCQYSVYDVEADSEDDAIDKGYEEFRVEMSRPIANTVYDEVEVEEIEEEDE